MSGVDELAVFVKVVEEGSFTAAARALQMPKSSISRNIARLEDRLGVRLLNRTTRSLSTTTPGAAFYERCVRIVAEIAEAEEALTAQQVTPRGPLTLAAPDLLSPWLGPILGDFLLAHPTIQLVLCPSDPADVIIASGPPSEATPIVHWLPGTERILCAAPDYLRRCGTPTMPDDLRGHACLLVGSRTAGIWVLSGGVSVPVSGPLAVRDAGVLRQSAFAGLGIAMLPRVVVAADLADATLVEVLTAHTGPGRAMYIHAAQPSAGARAFVDFLLARL